MPKHRKSTKSKLIVAVLFAFAVGTAGVFAQTSNVLLERVQEALQSNAGRPNIKLNLSGEVLRSNDSIPLSKAGVIGEGEVLRWTLESANIGDGVAKKYRTVGQIPVGTTIVQDSIKAEGKYQVTYSIDGGKSFKNEPTVEQRQPDGSVKQVPAPLESYTQVRYEWSDDLPAGSHLMASYQVRVR